MSVVSIPERTRISADIPGKCVHVYREPRVDGYALALEFNLTDSVSPLGLPAVQVMVGTLFS
jgi:hypothetical protein